MRRKRYDVLFYLPSVTPLLTGSGARPSGGAETQIVLLARTLAGRGAHVGLVAFPSAGPIPATVDGVDILVRSEHKAHQRLVGKLREATRIGWTIARTRARVVVVRVAAPQVGLVALAARLLGRRFVYSSANVLDFKFSSLGLKRRDLFLYRIGLRLAHRIVVQTDEQRELCRDVLGRDPVVIRSLGQTADLAGDPEFLLWIGRLVTYKQPLAFVELARSLPHVPCRLVGVVTPESGSIPTMVRNAARGVANLELVEPVPRPELLRLVERAAAIVSTSDYEGMPNIFLEGWARGVPALTLSHDPDGVIARYGLGVAAYGDRDAFVAGARELWDDRGRTAEFADRCRRYVVEHHSGNVVASAWEGVIGFDPGPSAARLAQSPS